MRVERGAFSHALVAGAAGVALMLLVGAVSGQDYNWDLLNYHFASPDLLLSGRTAVHVAPSGLQSWFNPLGYIPAYLAIGALPPWLAAGLLAAVVGLNAPLIYLIADRVGVGMAAAQRIRANYICVAIGMSGVVAFSEAGTTFLDAQLSIPILAALLLVIDAIERRRAGAVGLAGVLLGAACGLKLTSAPFALGMAVAVVALVATGRLPVRAVAMLALGGVAGFALTGGWWAWRMWEAFGNPVFPMFNDVFRSPAAPAVATVDATYLPKSWTGVVTYPWHWLIGDAMPGSELGWRDLRYPLALIASLVAAAALWSRGREQRAAGAVVALFCLASYIVWLLAFAILRYFVIVEMLSGVALVAALTLLPVRQQRAIPAVTIAVAFVLALTTRYADWGRAPFTGDWFGARGIAAVHRPGTAYVLPGDTPLGFMIHEFPDDARFMRIGGTFPLTPDRGLGARAAAMIADAPRVMSLSAVPLTPQEIAALGRFGLALAPGRCGRIATKVADVAACPLVRRGDQATLSGSENRSTKR